MENHKQTWWDKEIKTQFNEFKSWVGNSNAESKRWARKYIKNRKFSSLVDIGCGIGDDYFAYKNEQPFLFWQGVDSSQFLVAEASSKGIPIIQAEAHNIPFKDSQFDIAYSRHVLEHQNHYKPMLNEMIRLADKMVMHIFFIPPRENEIINFNPDNNLYHNTYNRKEIEDYLANHPKVTIALWIPITKTEEALVIQLNN